MVPSTEVVLDAIADDEENYRRMRTFGVEEELLLVDATTLRPLPAGERAVALHRELYGETSPSGHAITTELQQEQIEVVSAPCATLDEQLTAIRAGRALADEAAARVGGRAVALPTAPGPVSPHPVPGPRHQAIAQRFRIMAAEQLTCGLHIHVAIHSREEAVAVLDRMRAWLPVLLALSANSPFWQGTDTGYASYRYEVFSRLPASGPTDVFGSVTAYTRYRAAQLATCVPLDAGMLYTDARLSERHPTVEVRVTDVCLEAGHAVVLAALARALVEAGARRMIGVADVPASVLRSWSWQASRHGVDGQLIDPATGAPAAAGDVVSRLMEILGPVLAEYGEREAVEATVAEILGSGSGARRQRETFATSHDIRDVVVAALKATHRAAPAVS